MLKMTQEFKENVVTLIQESVSISDDDPSLCACGLDASDHTIASATNRFTCPTCQNWMHFVCQGTLDGFAEEFMSKEDPSGRIGCHRCPIEQYSDEMIRDVSVQERKRITYLRIAVKTVIMHQEIFVPLHEQISPLVTEISEKGEDYLRSLIYKYFTTWQRNYDSLPYSNDYDYDYSSENEKVYTPFYLSPPSSPRILDLPVPQTTVIEEVVDHTYNTDLSCLQLPPIPLNVRSLKHSSSRSTRRTTLKTYFSLSTIARRKRKFYHLLSRNYHFAFSRSRCVDVW